MNLKSIAHTPSEMALSPIDALEQNLVEQLKRKHPDAPIPALQDAVHITLKLAKARVVDLV